MFNHKLGQDSKEGTPLNPLWISINHPFYLTSILTFCLAFSLACVRVQAWPTASGARDMEFGSQGIAKAEMRTKRRRRRRRMSCTFVKIERPSPGRSGTKHVSKCLIALSWPESCSAWQFSTKSTRLNTWENWHSWDKAKHFCRASADSNEAILILLSVLKIPPILL